MTYVQAIEFRAGRERRPAIGRSHAARCTPSAPARRSRRSTFRATSSATSSRASGRRSSSSTTSSTSRPATSRRARLQARSRPATADLPAVGRRLAGFAPGPLVVEQYVLTNPGAELRPVPAARDPADGAARRRSPSPAGYAVGSEFGARSVGEWLAAAGGSPLAALVGKLAPYFGIFLLMMVVGAVIIHGVFEVPFRGDPVLIGAAACLLVVGLSFARRAASAARPQPRLRPQPDRHLLLAGLRFCRRGLSGAGMGGFAAGLGHRCCRCAGTSRSCSIRPRAACRPAIRSEPFVILGGAGRCVYFGLAWLRLRSRRPRKPAPAEPAPPADAGRARPGIARRLCRRICAACSRDRGAFGLIVLAPLIYGVFYPQPYLGQLIRAVPIAVVDDDSSELSRGSSRASMPTRRSVSRVRASTLAEAQAALARREVFGILDIPAGTEREVLTGRRRACRPTSIPPISCSTIARCRASSRRRAAVTADLLSRECPPRRQPLSRGAGCKARRSRS